MDESHLYSEKNTKWQDKYIFIAYELAKERKPDKEIAAYFDVTPHTFMNWKKEIPLLRLALGLGKRREMTLQDDIKQVENIIGGLSEEAETIFQRVRNLKAKGAAPHELAKLWTKEEENFQIDLFIHVYLRRGYDATKTMQYLGISFDKFLKWRENPYFHQRMEEVRFHQLNLLEKELFSSVKSGNVKTIMFAIERLNKERFGKVDTQVVNQTVNINNNTKSDIEFTWDEIQAELSVTEQVAVLNAIRRLRQRKMEDEDIIDVPVLQHSTIPQLEHE